jgi:branched-chain amino acid transport system ATP-binding protein
MINTSILSIKNLEVYYGAIRALKGINLEVEPGKIIAILGANGAGKTTLLRTISGLIEPKSGALVYQNIILNKKPADEIVRMGITHCPEGRIVFRDLTVLENLKVGGFTLKNKADLNKNLEKVFKYFPDLKIRQNQIASTLSGGEQQMLAIGRSLMGSPKVLLLDEPSLGLAPLIIKNIFTIIKEIKEQGTTIVIVEQNALQTLKIADYAYVLSVGQVIAEGPSEKLLKDENLSSLYLKG